MTSLPAFFTLAAILVPAAPAERNPPAATRPADPGLAGPGFELRWAESEDGERFTDTGKVLARHAAAPDLVRLPDDSLLAIFETSDTSGPEATPVFAVSRSQDEGKTWSGPRAISIEGRRMRGTTVHRPDLIVMPSGLLRLYFTEVRKPERERALPAVIRSAVSRDGLAYRSDPLVRLPIDQLKEPAASAFASRDEITLLIGELIEGQREGETRRRLAATQRYSSSDGRRFRPARREREPLPVGNVVEIRREALRLYCTMDGNVQSMLSSDGERWRRQPAVCIENATDPAVVQLADDKYLMLYCRAMSPISLAEAMSASQAADEGAGEDAKSSAETSTSSGEATDGVAWRPFTESALEEELGADATAMLDAYGAVFDDGFAPVADLHNPVDYLKWLAEEALPPEDINAYFAYVLRPETETPEWRALSECMLGSDYGGPIGPWSPAEHPDWENAYHLTQGLMQQYHEATLSTDPFAVPFTTMFGSKYAPYPADGRPLLVDMLLPGLADVRGLAKVALSNAWRMDDSGTVSPDAMLGAIADVHRNGDHCWQGSTLIEQLVGLALQESAQHNARLAMQHDVFQSPEDLAGALDTIRRINATDHDMRGGLVMEHAWINDMLQYVAEADTPGGTPYIHKDRVQRIFESLFGEESMQSAFYEEKADFIDNLTVDDIEQGVEALDEFYRELSDRWQTGYPTYRGRDVEDLAIECMKKTPLLEPFIPSLSRAYELECRGKASRRATELTCAINLFRAQTGRLPVSLNELPDYRDSDTRIDPFTGKDFIYRLTEDGSFTIYTAYDNGIDDGGVHDNDCVADYVFWPPQ